jgi:hydroxypyruvate isomerase
MFNEVPFLDRFHAAAGEGFKAVEFLFPYEHEPEVVAAKAAAAKVEVILFNLPAGNWAAGERGIACLPGREQEFRAGIDKALAYQAVLGTKQLHAMAGIVPAGVDPLQCHGTLVRNLRYAAGKLAPLNLTLLLEAINTRDMPGFAVSTQKESSLICDLVDAPNLKMQMDLYHMQIMEGDLAICLERYACRCAHIQIAGCPERHEPDTGEIRYEYLYNVIDQTGYSGWLGCEYRPAGKTSDGLGWFRAVSQGA